MRSRSGNRGSASGNAVWNNDNAVLAFYGRGQTQTPSDTAAINTKCITNPHPNPYMYVFRVLP